MKRTLFVLLIVSVLAGALVAMFIYDKKIILQEQTNAEIDESKKQITEDEIDGITEENASKNEDTKENEENQDEKMIGRLIINKINLEGEVKEGSSSEILNDYIGHIEETSKFDGNVGLAAHNRGNKYSYFSRINELEKGDEIVYQTKYGERKYIVTDKKEILETDWSMLRNTKENKLTLITCIRNKVNQRLCVQAIQSMV